MEALHRPGGDGGAYGAAGTGAGGHGTSGADSGGACAGGPDAGRLGPDAAGAGDAGNICLICGRGQRIGLHIAEEFICSDCEREMVRTEVWDAKYPYFVHRMKQMWRRKDA